MEQCVWAESQRRPGLGPTIGLGKDFQKQQTNGFALKMNHSHPFMREKVLGDLYIRWD